MCAVRLSNGIFAEYRRWHRKRLDLHILGPSHVGTNRTQYDYSEEGNGLEAQKERLDE